MPRYACSCVVRGSAFAGTAPQPDRRTVHGELRSLLADLAGDGQQPVTRSSGRLDAGTSALTWVFDVALPGARSPREVARAITGILQPDLVVTRVAAVADDWHALRCCQRKTYRYRLYEAPQPPVLEGQVWWQRPGLDVGLLADCAGRLVGRHDLSAFAAKRGDGSDDGDPERDYQAAAWTSLPAPGGEPGRVHEFRITGTGFLYKQVRGLVGAMVAVARGRTSAAGFRAAIGAGRLAPRLGQIAPAEALVLERAEFAPEPAWEAVR